MTDGDHVNLELDQTRPRTRCAGLLVLLILATSLLSCSDDPKQNQAAACELGVKTVGLIVAHVHNGEDVAEILGIVEPGLVEGCKQTVSDLLNHPTTPFSFKLQTNNGSLSEVLSLNQLVAPPPSTTPTTRPNVDLERILACVQSFNSQVLIDLCVDHTIDPIGP